MGTMGNELDHLFMSMNATGPNNAALSVLYAGVSASSGGGGPNVISPLQVAVGAALILVNACISFYLSLGLEVALAVATVRCIVQLSILGYILVPIFTYNMWELVLAYSCLMAFIGAYEAISRPSYTFKMMLPEVLAATAGSSGIFLAYALVFIVRTHPWWDAQYFIPMLGMILGNCISGISVGLTTLLEELTSGKDKVELLLSMGATRWEATREIIQRSVRVAMTPVLNQMNVVGIVSIPGMMTGQILGGTDPSQAARYQMIIMFLLAATTGLGTTSAVYAATATIVDPEHRIRLERLTPRASRGTKAWDALFTHWASASRRMSGFFRKRSGGPSPAEAAEAREPLLASNA